jgi:hypothetical protein
MAYSKGTMAQGGTSGAVTAITCSATYAAHDVAWVVGTYGVGTPLTETVTDGTNTYVKLGSTIADGPNGQCMVQFYCKDCAAGTYTVSFNLASSTSVVAVFVLPIHGLDNTATPVGGGQLQSSPGAATDAISSGNITPGAQPGFFGGLVLDTSDFSTNYVGGTLFTDNGGLTAWDGASLPHSRYEDVRITSTSAKAATFTATPGPGNNIVMAFTFPEPAAGSTFPPVPQSLYSNPLTSLIAHT